MEEFKVTHLKWLKNHFHSLGVAFSLLDHCTVGFCFVSFRFSLTHKNYSPAFICSEWELKCMPSASLRWSCHQLVFSSLPSDVIAVLEQEMLRNKLYILELIGTGSCILKWISPLPYPCGFTRVERDELHLLYLCKEKEVLSIYMRQQEPGHDLISIH